MARILVACANGSGTSLLMKMAVEKATDRLGIPVSNIHHCSLSEGVSSAHQYDVVFVPLNFLSMYDEAKDDGVMVIGMRNVTSDKEAEEKLIENGAVEKFKR